MTRPTTKNFRIVRLGAVIECDDPRTFGMYGCWFCRFRAWLRRWF